LIHQLPLPDRLQSFRRITSCSISLSSEGQPLLQLAVLFLELTQSLHLRRHQATVLLAPIVVRGLADPGLATDLTDRCAFLALAQDEGDLRLATRRSSAINARFASCRLRTDSLSDVCTLSLPKSYRPQ
jgi:hypothetical protein